MQQLFFADVFFLVTTISVILVAAATVTLVLYCALIARDIRKISKKLKNESITTIDNIVSVKNYIFAERERVIDLVFLISDIVKGFSRPRSAQATRKRPTRKRATKVSVREEE